MTWKRPFIHSTTSIRIYQIHHYIRKKNYLQHKLVPLMLFISPYPNLIQVSDNAVTFTIRTVLHILQTAGSSPVRKIINSTQPEGTSSCSCVSSTASPNKLRINARFSFLIVLYVALRQSCFRLRDILNLFLLINSDIYYKYYFFLKKYKEARKPGKYQEK